MSFAEAVQAAASSASKAATTSDLCELAIADSTIVVALQERFQVRLPFTSLSPSAVVFLNPYTFINADDGGGPLSDYVDDFYRLVSAEDGSEGGGKLWKKSSRDPHVFQLALNSYYNMKRTGQDQALITSGGTASGKSELKRMAIEAICQVSVPQPGKKGSKIGLQISSAEFVLKCFGNAHTLTSDDSSRFGAYTELQFGKNGRLEGLKILQYYFERSKVSQAPINGERNFNIFYYLLSGLPEEEKSFLKLGDHSQYRYLHCRVRRIGIDDHQRFQQLKHAFKLLGLSTRLVAQIYQLLAAILHIGNLQFNGSDSSEEGSTVVNTDTLSVIAEFLGISSEALAELFSSKVIVVRKESCMTFLNPEQAEQVRDELAQTLYSLLFAWLNEHLNSKLCKDSFESLIALVDLPGIQHGSGPNPAADSLDQFCFNLGAERLHSWVLHRIHDIPEEEARREGLRTVPIPYFDNSECLEVLSQSKGGVISIMDHLSQHKKPESALLEALEKQFHNNPSISITPSQNWKARGSFTINHYDGPVTYTTADFLERNANQTSTDIVQLLGSPASKGHETSDARGSSNPFIKSLFSRSNISTQTHPQSSTTIVAAQQPIGPVRAPSTRRRKDKPLVAIAESEEENVLVNEKGPHVDPNMRCMAGQHSAAITSLLSTFEQAQIWYIFCIRPNESQLPSQVDIRTVRSQVKSLGIVEIAQKLQTNWEVRLSHKEACERYEKPMADRGISQTTSDIDKLRDLKRVLKLSDQEMAVGTEHVFFSHYLFRYLEDSLRAYEESPSDRPAAGSRGRELYDPFSPYRAVSSPGILDRNYDDASTLFSVDRSRTPGALTDHTLVYNNGPAEAASNVDLAGYSSSDDLFADSIHKSEKDPLDTDTDKGQVAEVYKESIARRRWVGLCTVLTGWIPTIALSKLGGMQRPDIRQAWREKLAINMLIWFICGCAIFVIAVMGNLICPTQNVYSSSELASHSYDDDPNSAYVAIRGEVFDLSSFLSTHLTAVSVVDSDSVMDYGGLDATDLFPVDVSALCNGTSGSLSPYVTFDTSNTTDTYSKYHDFRGFQNDSRPDWYAEMMIMMRHRFRVGFMGYTSSDISDMASNGRAVAIYKDVVYETTSYIQSDGGGLTAPDGVDLTSQDQTDRAFMSDEIISLFKYDSGKDITDLVDALGSTIGEDVLENQRQCLRNLFIIGKLDTRDSVQCQFSTYILLALSCVMVAVIGFKFLAALYFGSSRAPESHDKFVICQVPCYTEGEDSLRRTIDSLVKLRYDDKRKLILIVCDGNIKGYGNEKPTPAIVLDILGVDPTVSPEPLSFQSLGEGAKQHNMGKVYAGLYECAGHVVPYLVVVKTGKPSERSRPGNRGKRDSQMVIMHFLNKVHFNALMNPLELEMYHQIKNVIGVNPGFYEYLFLVDADTTVDELSLNRFISAMMHDKKIIGVCGETSIANAKQSIVTMSQVYEYFISHHLAKAFESLFGSITCLPGCFSMYRLRTPDTNRPLFIANSIIQDYSENRVDTLHLKNLLHLGEDRYLTTLVLKTFVDYKTKFVRDAHARTVAPDSVKVLLSQRRRWINSTVHNLAELVFLEQLCGFCCFSMRFVVMIDLVSTLVAPVTVAYIGYLIYLVVHDGSSIPTLSIIMLAAIYGLQALIFIFRLRWDMIAWMIFYILAIPVFSFFLPLYSFWKMDDFSWGSTRLVVGEKGKKIVIHDEGKFDPSSIPLKSWEEYENELWDHDSTYPDHFFNQEKAGSVRSGTSHGQYGYPTGMSPSPSIRKDHYSESISAMGPLHPDMTGSRSYHEAYNHNPFAGAGGPWMNRSMSGESLYHPRHAGGSQLSLIGPDYHSQSFRDSPSQISQNNLPFIQPSGMSVNYLGSQGISDLDLESAIRRICETADLDQMTKKGVRKKLEVEFGVNLDDRRESINRILEEVLSD